jgi:hypothetical protein
MGGLKQKAKSQKQKAKGTASSKEMKLATRMSFKL